MYRTDCVSLNIIQDYLFNPFQIPKKLFKEVVWHTVSIYGKKYRLHSPTAFTNCTLRNKSNMCMYVCMYVSMYVCMYICTYVFFLLYLLARSITLYLVILHAIYIELTVVIFTLIVYNGYYFFMDCY